jgi:hypothetical protein
MTTTKEDIQNSSECNELKTIKYKSMLMNGIAWPEKKNASDLINLDKFLENEKITNSNEPWSKLDKTVKTKKLILFAEKYKADNALSEDEYSKMIVFFKDCLDKKRLQRVKDVVYDKETGTINDIPALHYNKPTTHFTLKNVDKRVSTTRSLAPKKAIGRGTIKNITNDDSESEDDK